MKKKIVSGIIAFLILVLGFIAWKFIGSTIHAPEKKFFYINTGKTYDEVKKDLYDLEIISGTTWFNWAAKMIGYNSVKPGRYEIKRGMSLVSLVRMLKNGQQTPVNFIITKIRTKEVLASRVGAVFECDSVQMIHFLNNADSLKQYGLDTNTVMSAAMPFTYTIRWNTTAAGVFEQFYTAYKTFWTPERKQKADSLGLSPAEVSAIASIIDEETNSKKDKPTVASVYLNRIKKGMPLQADPTLKFALRDFGLKRILNVHKDVQSAYNTYSNKGIPPGPICTPQLETIDAVLNSPKTDYLYFVANSTFDGSHIFTTNYAEHMKFARLYQQELNKRNIK
ncbi:MAG: endolytic transglycosylase MltG [Chitinophagaceae bacterium]